jgi:hypothetical protein
VETPVNVEAAARVETPKAAEVPKPPEAPAAVEEPASASGESPRPVETGKIPEADKPIPDGAAESAPVPETSETPAPAETGVLFSDSRQPEGLAIPYGGGPEIGGGESGPVLAPLADAALEVLGDGVFWLGAGHDLTRELSAVLEAKRILLLASGEEAGFEIPAAASETIPARMADIGVDAAERFLFRIRDGPLPLVAAVLPGAEGAAFFKGAYLLLERNMDLSEAFSAILPDLPESGETGDEIRHRLSRLRESAGK